jgi:hypothetical protein
MKMLENTKKSDIGITSIFSALIKKQKTIINLFIVYSFVIMASQIAAAQDDKAHFNRPGTASAGSLPSKPDSQPVSTRPVKNPAKIAFEKLLKFEIPATYNFYEKLSSRDQDKVVKTYNQEKKMSVARKLIFDLYFLTSKKSSQS